jgi:phospholipid-translocating ATPase/phospholipid-transporting ATPase
MLNTEPPPRKVSQLERHMNWLVVMMFAFMLLVSVGMAFGHMAFLQTSNRWYIYTEGTRLGH